MARKIFIRSLFLLFVSLPLLFAEPVRVEHVEAELVSEVKSIKPGEPFWVGIRLAMDEGWHTYWQNPGDSGLASSVAWKLPEGIKPGALEWPYPEKIESASFVTYGYEDEVLLLTKMEPDRLLPVGSNQMIQTGVEWLSCKEICVPGQADLKIILPVGSEALVDAVNQTKFLETKRRLPKEVPDWNFNAQKIGNRIICNVTVPEGVSLDWGDVQFFPLGQGVINHAAPQKFKKLSEQSFEMKLQLPAMVEKPLTRLTGILVSKNGLQAGGKVQAVLIDAPVREVSWTDYILELIQSWMKKVPKGDRQ